MRDVAGFLCVSAIVVVAWLATESWPHTLAIAFLAGVMQVRATACRRAAEASAAAASEQWLKTSLRAAVQEGQRGSDARLLSLELHLDRVRSVFESLREGVLVADAGGEVVLANPAARRALRSPAQPPEGKLLWDVLGVDLVPFARGAWQSLRSDKGPVAGDATGNVCAIPRETAPVRCSAIQFRDSVYDLTAFPVSSQRTGQDFGTAFLLVDSTRSHELQHLKDRFLSSISHELRTPLTNICAYAEILRHMVPGDHAEWPEFVRVIHEEGLHLSLLVDAVFDYLRLESGEVDFKTEEVDPRETVVEAVRQLEGRAGRNGVTVRVTAEPGLPHVRADRGRFLQACCNLIDNAVKFTPAGGRVDVALAARDGFVELRVDDSGPGVPSTDRAAVFDKFHQLRDHLTDKPEGTGLGLATTRAIVTRLGGLVWCEDSPLGGARFVVLLPAAMSPASAGSAVKTANAASASAANSAPAVHGAPPPSPAEAAADSPA